MTLRIRTLLVAIAALEAAAAPARAQSTTPQPWGRVSFFVNTWQIQPAGGAPASRSTDLSATFTYQFPDLETAGSEYGADLRFAKYVPTERPERVSIYEAYVGGRLAGGAVRVRAGNLWLNDLGGLGSVAGGLFEVRQKQGPEHTGRVRAGAFVGFEPDLYEASYTPDIRKAGGYFAYDGERGRRHVAGFVTVRNGALTERSVVTTSNYLPLKQSVFIYQAAEFDVRPPAGRAQAGLTYFFTNARWTATSRVDLMGTYNRGRSIDVRGLSQEILAGRPVLERNISGLLYESIGGRLTVTVVHGVRVYGGYNSDKTDRDAHRTARILIGGYAGNLAGSGFDLSASDSIVDRPDGSYESRYFSVGHQIGRRFYLSGDYSTSLSIVRFSRSDGVLVEFRPHTRRYTGTGTWNASRRVSVLITAERAADDGVDETRLLSGLTYRFR